jgi:cell division septation protein DedD
MPEDFDPTKSDVDSMPAWKKPKNRKKPAIKDTLSFIQPADFFQRQGMGADVNDPHLLRPDEERLAAWISDQLATDVMAAYDEDPTDAEPKAELIERNGFVLNLMGVSTADAIGFLQRRVAEQTVPVKAIVKPATGTPETTTPKEAKPTPTQEKAVSAPQPVVKATKKPAAKPVSKPKTVPATKGKKK